jgi:hypothetical protein
MVVALMGIAIVSLDSEVDTVKSHLKYAEPITTEPFATTMDPV